MAVSKNSLVHLVSGKFGEDFVFRQRNGKTFLAKYPDMSKRKLSPKQKRGNDLFWYAVAHARGILNHEPSRNEALIRLNVTRNRLFNALMSEYMKSKLTPEGKIDMEGGF